MSGRDGWVLSVLGRVDGLYAFGSFDKSGTTVVNGAARWDGSSWQPVGAGFPSRSYPYASVSWGSDLVVAGDFDSAGGLPASNIARWDGSTWHALGSGLDENTLKRLPYSTAISSPAESSPTPAGVRPAGSRDGTAPNGRRWARIVSEVSALRVIDGRLYAGGSFRCADG